MHSLVFPVSGQEEDSGCEVQIVGTWPGPDMYPGQESRFEAETSGADAVTNYSWTVEGPVIKDYDDSVQQSDYLKATRNVGNYTQMSPSDFQDREVKFYWQPNSTDINGTDTNRTVSISVQTANGEICQDSQDYSVAMSNSSNFQAEDFYVDYNHKSPFFPFTNIVLKEHQNWHRNVSRCCDENYNGTLFFDFHNLFLAHFDAWRNLFGYDNITEWNPNDEIPNRVDVNHENREFEGVPYYPFYNQTLPEWFKMYPGDNGPHERIVSDTGCEARYQDPSGDIEDSLGDFDSNRMLLGCILTHPFHNTVHGNIGQSIDRNGDGRFDSDELGDMNKPATAPLDPVFWRFHKFIDEISLNRTNLDEEGTPVIAVAPPSPIVDDSLPQLVSQNPFRLNPFITQLPKISEQEKDLFGITDVEAISVEFDEPVLGVRATDFSVNGSFAEQVNGTGSGPYVFIGFQSPGSGPLNVTLSAGNITDISGNPFGGDSWKYVIVEKDQDQDLDGARDDIEANILLTNPLVNDTDGDTIPDGFEATSTCLDPLSDDSHIMDITGEIVNDKPIDSDTDGVSNIQEFRQGTNPCPQIESEVERKEIKQGFALDTQNLVPRMRSLEGIEQDADEPFMLAIEKTDGFSGQAGRFSYNSVTNEVIYGVNNNETRKQVSDSDEDSARRILNNSEFFESDSFYPPAPNGTDYQEYTLIGSLGSDLNAVYWTSASEQVPSTVENLPYILANVFGVEGLF